MTKKTCGQILLFGGTIGIGSAFSAFYAPSSILPVIGLAIGLLCIATAGFIAAINRW